MILSTVKVEDFDRFWNTFSTKAPRSESSTGPRVRTSFAIQTTTHRFWIVFDWDEQGLRASCPIPKSPAIFQEAGLQEGPRGGARPRTRRLSRSPPLRLLSR